MLGVQDQKFTANQHWSFFPRLGEGGEGARLLQLCTIERRWRSGEWIHVIAGTASVAEDHAATIQRLQEVRPPRPLKQWVVWSFIWNPGGGSEGACAFRLDLKDPKGSVTFSIECDWEKARAPSRRFVILHRFRNRFFGVLLCPLFGSSEKNDQWKI